MKKLIWIRMVLLAFHLFNASSQDTIGWWNIDCGSDDIRLGANLLLWSSDKDFTQSGIAKKLPQKQQPEEMSTLRFFPNQSDQNCYTLPVYPQTLRYLICAGFFYGNYDGLGKPPAFDLRIDGQKWTTVRTAAAEGLVYEEAVYVTQGSGSIRVCLVQIRDGEFPFISSLEAVPLWVNLYPQMGNNVTFQLVSRTNFGGLEVRYSGLFSEEKYNRIWTRGETPPNCHEVSTLPDSTCVPKNDPPAKVLRDSIESPNASIVLSVDRPQNYPQFAYFVFYLTELVINPDINDVRIMDIHINGDKKYTVASEFSQCKVVTIYPLIVMGPTINITLGPARGSTLPPMISAMEVFTRINPDEDHGKNSASSALYHFSFTYWIYVLSLAAILLA